MARQILLSRRSHIDIYWAISAEIRDCALLYIQKKECIKNQGEFFLTQILMDDPIYVCNKMVAINIPGSKPSAGRL